MYSRRRCSISSGMSELYKFCEALWVDLQMSCINHLFCLTYFHSSYRYLMSSRNSVNYKWFTLLKIRKPINYLWFSLLKIIVYICFIFIFIFIYLARYPGLPSSAGPQLRPLNHTLKPSSMESNQFTILLGISSIGSL